VTICAWIYAWKGTGDIPLPIKLESRLMTYTVLVRRKTQQQQQIYIQRHWRLQDIFPHKTNSQFFQTNHNINLISYIYFFFTRDWKMSRCLTINNQEKSNRLRCYLSTASYIVVIGQFTRFCLAIVKFQWYIFLTETIHNKVYFSPLRLTTDRFT
jgi:hypothetical protein